MKFFALTLLLASALLPVNGVPTIPSCIGIDCPADPSGCCSPVGETCSASGCESVCSFGTSFCFFDSGKCCAAGETCDFGGCTSVGSGPIPEPPQLPPVILNDNTAATFTGVAAGLDQTLTFGYILVDEFSPPALATPSFDVFDPTFHQFYFEHNLYDYNDCTNVPTDLPFEFISSETESNPSGQGGVFTAIYKNLEAWTGDVQFCAELKLYLHMLNGEDIVVDHKRFKFYVTVVFQDNGGTILDFTVDPFDAAPIQEASPEDVSEGSEAFALALTPDIVVDIPDSEVSLMEDITITLSSDVISLGGTDFSGYNIGPVEPSRASILDPNTLLPIVDPQDDGPLQVQVIEFAQSGPFTPFSITFRFPIVLFQMGLSSVVVAFDVSWTYTAPPLDRRNLEDKPEDSEIVTQRMEATIKLAEYEGSESGAHQATVLSIAAVGGAATMFL